MRELPATRTDTRFDVRGEFIYVLNFNLQCGSEAISVSKCKVTQTHQSNSNGDKKGRMIGLDAPKLYVYNGVSVTQGEMAKQGTLGTTLHTSARDCRLHPAQAKQNFLSGSFETRVHLR